MSHIALGGKRALPTYRKIALASWRRPRDPSTYAWADLSTAAAAAFLKDYAKEHPEAPKPTLTHFIAKIIADCLVAHPQLNHLLRSGNLFQRKRTDIFITTMLKTELGLDLSGFALEDMPSLSLSSVAQLSDDAVRRLRRGEDQATRQIDSLAAHLPTWLMRVAMAFEDFVHFTLNISLSRLGLPDDRFGSAMISNFGVLGIENALIPLSPYCRCPLIVGIGHPRPLPIAKDGAVVVADCVNISFTFDHRHADGADGALLVRRFQKIFLNPAQYRDVFEANLCER